MKTNSSIKRFHQAGFTLIELVIVIAILASLAGSAVLMVGAADESSHVEMGRIEIGEIRDALIQFKRDMGYMPTHGPLALVDDGGAVPMPAEGEEWFYNPANFAQLFENPFAGSSHSFENWNPETKRGWRGPYLSGSSERFVTVGDSLQSDGGGSPAMGGVLNNVMGIADPFVGTPVGAYLSWKDAFHGGSIDRSGRPYLLLDAGDSQKARILSFGPNRTYEGGGGDDLVLYLFR